MKQYHCHQCGSDFELDDGAKVRCPSCMGIHNIDRRDDVKRGARDEDNGADTDKERGGTMRSATIALLVVLLAASGYLLWRHYAGDPPEDAAAPVSDKDVARQLQALGLDADDAVSPFAVTESLTAFARRIAASRSGAEALDALMSQVATWKAEGRLVAFDQVEPRPEPPQTAGDILDKLLATDADAAPLSLSSYELAGLLLAWGQALEIGDLHMLEIFHYRAEKAPADPHAIYGRFAVSLGAPQADRAVPVFDPWAGRTLKSDAVDAQRLSLSESLAPWYAHQSLAAFARMDFPQARKDNDIAIRLAENNALLRIHRGKIFMASGALEEGLKEFEKARHLKNWAVTRVSLAQVSMLNDPSGAQTEAEIRKALQEFPAYLQAQLILALVQAQTGKTDAAQATLQAAQAQAPTAPDVAVAWAQFHLLQRDTDAAIAAALQAVRLSKESASSLLLLAQVYQATARFDEARDAAKRAMAKMSSDSVKQQLRQAFNITDEALEDAPQDSDAQALGDADVDVDAPVLPEAPRGLELQFEQQGDTPLGGGKLRLGGGEGLRLNP
ncbi:MAG: hypothetical protein M0R76_08160 [Proteobacteria bacterium]|nr:hypothetical protein [Pseudomonadota bacterium]